MDVVKEFLESSSIGGLNFISSTKNLARLFWICVVTAAFTISFMEIHTLFQDWKKNPIKSTTEIRVCLQKSVILPRLQINQHNSILKEILILFLIANILQIIIAKIEIHKKLRHIIL